jgi:hypothetical protein
VTAVRTTSGFGALVRGVEEYFASLKDGTMVVCGYRERAQQTRGTGGANRVVFLPGDPNGAGGKLVPPRDPGPREVLDELGETVATVRALVSWERQFSISVWGYDAAAPRDALRQIEAAEALLEKTVRAIEQVAGAGGPNLVWGPALWTLPKDNTFGQEVLVGLAFAHPLFDAPSDVGFPGFTLKRTGADQ